MVVQAEAKSHDYLHCDESLCRRCAVTSQMTVRLSAKLHHQFRSITAGHGVAASAVLREMVEQYVTAYRST